MTFGVTVLALFDFEHAVRLKPTTATMATAATARSRAPAMMSSPVAKRSFRDRKAVEESAVSAINCVDALWRTSERDGGLQQVVPCSRPDTVRLNSIASSSIDGPPVPKLQCHRRRR